jgi:hypothetical protein
MAEGTPKVFTQEEVDAIVKTKLSEGGKAFTQEEVNAIIKDRLAREKEKYKDYDDLSKKVKDFEEKEKAGLPENEKLRKEFEELKKLVTLRDGDLAQQKLLNVKLEMLDQAELPKFWAKRILGTTEEEIKADIAEIKEALGEKKENVGKGIAPASKGGKELTINDRIRGKK